MGTTVQKYLDWIFATSKEDGIYAYRGQRVADWGLNSAATRRLIREHGPDIVQDPEFPSLYVGYHRTTLIEPARTQGHGSEAGRVLTDLELLAKLQHFGAETGLLDFSWNPLVALWFLCGEEDIDGKLFMINTNDPVRMAKVSPTQADQDLSAVLVADPGTQPVSYWEPTIGGDAIARILLQRSVFIIGRPFVSLESEVISEITVGKEDKHRLLAELNILDFNQESLFLDVYGFAQASKTRRVPDLSAGAYNRQGNRYYQQGDYDKALAAYNRSVQLAPDGGLTYLFRANVLAAAERHGEAIADYDKAIGHVAVSRRGILDSAHFNRGNSKAAVGDLDGAVEDYTQATEQNPERPGYYYNRGNAYFDLYRFSEAVGDYDKAIGSGSTHAVYNKGMALLSLGQLVEARSCFQNAAVMGYDHFTVQQNLWTLEQVMPLVDGLDYTVRAAPDPATNRMTLRFTIPAEVPETREELQRFLFGGRAGSIGSDGLPGLSGGKGLQGGEPMRVYVDGVSTDPPTTAG